MSFATPEIAEPTAILATGGVAQATEVGAVAGNVMRNQVHR